MQAFSVSIALGIETWIQYDRVVFQSLRRLLSIKWALDFQLRALPSYLRPFLNGEWLEENTLWDLALLKVFALERAPLNRYVSLVFDFFDSLSSLVYSLEPRVYFAEG